MKKIFTQKLLSFGLAMILGLSLTACSTSSSSATADSAESSAAEAESSESSAAAASPEAASAGSTEETTGETGSTETDSASGDSDLAAIQEKGTLVVGITNFEPMDYQDENGDWIGFDADLAKQFAEYLGVEVEFSEITWDYKVMELEAGNIDCVWNGMTLTDEVTSAMATSTPYCTNYQVLVYPAASAADFEGLTSLEGLNIAVESGSAGEDAAGWNGMTLTDEVTSAMATSTPYCTNYQVLVYPAASAADFEGLTSLEGLNIAVESGSAGEDAAEALGASTVPVQSQANTLMEVAAGTSDAAVIDVLMAAAMTGEGTSYADLAYSVNLNEAQGLESEQYGVGFRQGSDLVDEFNAFWAEKVADGTVEEIANTYGLQDAVILE